MRLLFCKLAWTSCAQRPRYVIQPSSTIPLRSKAGLSSRPNGSPYSYLREFISFEPNYSFSPDSSSCICSYIELFEYHSLSKVERWEHTWVLPRTPLWNCMEDSLFQLSSHQGRIGTFRQEYQTPKFYPFIYEGFLHSDCRSQTGIINIFPFHRCYITCWAFAAISAFV